MADIEIDKSELPSPVYLIVADETNEFDLALRYAGRTAQLHDARLAVLYIIPSGEAIFMPWANVSDKIAEEKRLESEQVLKIVGERLSEYGLTPALYLREGKPTDVILELVNSDPDICKLILAGDANGTSPGPLTSYFCGGKGLSELKVPVTIIPSHISEEALDHLARLG
jgi:nucleotide-binding universal stress UspA family protein